MDKYTNERILKRLVTFFKKINKRFKIEKAILFGSRARGDNLLTSDVDIIIVSPDFKEYSFRQRCGEVIGEWKEGVDLEALCYTPEEFERKKKQLGIVATAVSEGTEIKIAAK